MEITLDQAEVLVERRKDIVWDGWTLVHVIPYPAGWMRGDGLFKNGQWNIARRYPITEQGTYQVSRALGSGL